MANWKPEKYTLAQKQKIIEEVRPITNEDVVKDFEKLKKIGCNAKNILTLDGHDTVNKFTMTERYDTEGNKGKTFFDLLWNKKLINQPSYLRLLESMGKNKNNATVKQWMNLFQLYFGSPNIFRPIIAMEIYCRFEPTTVLDPTMGWGGRLVGACALNIQNYIGIDSNKKLKVPYQKLIKVMNQLSDTNIKVYFQDALTIDYSKIKYDMVLTSPPYYNIEIYSGTTRKTKDDWDHDFYIPLFEKTYMGLQRGGYYCINVPQEVYERVALKLLGRPTHKIILRKTNRAITDYHEYIYVWKKP